MAALVAQESTFQADVRSAANAWGLMQIVPRHGPALRADRSASGRSRRAGSPTPRPTSASARRYFADLLRAVRRRRRRRSRPTTPASTASSRGWPSGPGVDRDEFIDDIPFPETQNYVKRILGTAEDYRLLYGRGTSAPSVTRIGPLSPAMSRPRTSQKAAAVHRVGHPRDDAARAAARRRQPVAGVSGLSRAGGDQGRRAARRFAATSTSTP